MLNALVQTTHDNCWNAGTLSEDAKQALDHLWACQREDEAWLWLNFELLESPTNDKRGVKGYAACSYAIADK